MAKETVKHVVVDNSFTELLTSLGVNTNSITGKIGGVNVSKNEHHVVLSFFIRIKGIDVPFKLIRTKDNTEECKAIDEFKTNFQKGDYILLNCEVRQKGATYTSEDGKTGMYKDSYIAVPYLSSMNFAGESYILDAKRDEVELAKLELSKSMYE